VSAAVAPSAVRDADPRRARHPDRGAALLVVVLLAAALSISAGAVASFALVESQAGAAARDQAEAAVAVDAGLAIAVGALAAAPDLAAVRLGAAPAPGNGVGSLLTSAGAVDVTMLTRRLERRRGRLPPPADAAVWRPFLWGRLGELAATPIGESQRDPLIVAWVRGDEAGGLGPDRLELAIEAVTPSGGRAGAVAAVALRPGGAGILAVWPDTGIAAPG
jgi:hypothetical protein